MRSNENMDTYVITTARGIYSVVMQSLKRTVNGGPRFRAIITTLKVNGESEPAGYMTENGNKIVPLLAANYTFKGSYLSKDREAEKAVAYHEKKMSEA